MPRLPDDLPPQGAPGDATARFYDGVAAGYQAQVDDRAENAGVRLSFCERVASLAGPGGLILDFGCGTGTDAAWYAGRGHRAVAYDVSPGMVDVLRRRCRAEIESGLITPLAGPLDMLAPVLEQSGPVAAIAANFAVLNHVRDLGPLLQSLAPHLAPRGALVASLLNPFFGRDMLQAWWWRSAMRSLGQGAIRMEGSVTTYRHFAGAIRRAAEPGFAVEEVRAARRGALAGALGSNFLFVTLRRRP